MFKNCLLLVMCVTCLSFSSCLFSKECLRLESELKSANQQLEQKDEKCRNMEHRLKESEARINKSLKDLAAVKSQCEDLKNMNLNLSHKTKGLNIEVKKKNSIIQLHQKVVRVLDDAKKTIETSLKEQIETKLLEVEEKEGELKFVFPGRVLFTSGSVEISKKGKAILLKTAPTLKKNKARTILVQGHTDNLQVRSLAKLGIFTNWELSTARAVAVVRFLQEKVGIEPARLLAVGYSHYRPVASNNTEEGRSQNRRIEIIMNP